MKTLLIILTLFLLPISGYAQLIDPFGKVITHDIKLNKQKDGTYIGAVEWTTGGIDSLQRFTISGLDINAPVQVRIISKAPKHNIDLSFHKKKWDKVESKISTNGEKFIDKVFRTMGIAGIGVYSKVAGIPYLITVKVGLQFPSTQSFIRVTDDKEEYTRHLRSIGYQGALFKENNDDAVSISNSTDNNILMYIIIALLAVIAVLLGFFLMKRKSSSKTMLIVILLGIGQMITAQGNQPYNVPVGQLKVTIKDYKTQSINNQVPIGGENPNVSIRTTRQPIGDSGVMFNETTVRIETNPTTRELSPEEVRELNNRMGASDDQFDRDYREEMPGEPTEGDQRVMPPSPDRAELNRLRQQVRRLQQQVDLLSQEDEEYEPEEYDGPEIVIYCETIENCHNCIKQGLRKFNTHRVYLGFLQKFYLRKVTDLNDWIEYGNAMSSLPGGGGMAWAPILLHKVRPAMDRLKEAYRNKFDEYISSLKDDLEMIRACYTGINSDFPSIGAYEAQVYSVINALEASKINL